MKFENLKATRSGNKVWKDSCGPAWFNLLRGLNSKEMLQKLSLDEPLVMHYLLYLAGCR
ncbi:unnamed protein product [Meloidogyne enterolobii]|uniref:Uncharacterized protein n=1 Tax=Meloidogyne enterolobii TaxID=390850 RepID=A0ACB1AX13_MELEN